MGETKIISSKEELAKFNSPVSKIETAQRICNFLWKEIKESENREVTYIGLSAPQVGIHSRIAVIKHPRDGSCVELINPTIVEKEGPIILSTEGCISIENKHFHVPRYCRVVVESQKIENGEFKNQILIGDMTSGEKEDILFCASLQHEIDHLNGVIISDYKEQNAHPQVRDIWDRLAKEQEESYRKSHTPIKRSKKIGRNTPCNCGSGKKNKNCCNIKTTYEYARK